MTDPTDEQVREIARGLTKAQADALSKISAECARRPGMCAAHDVGAKGICCDFLYRHGMLSRASDPKKWGRSIYDTTALGRRVAAVLREGATDD